MSKPNDPKEHTLTGTMNIVAGTFRPARPAVLEQVQGPGAPRRIELKGNRFVVGREGDIPVASVQLSRNHLCLVRLGSTFSFVDLDSSNGVFLNGIRVHSAELRDGDQLQLGDVVFIYESGA